MTFRHLSMLAVLAASALCFAQDEQGPPPREPGAGRGPGGDSQPLDRRQMQANQMERQIRFISRALELDEEQQAQFDQIAEKYLKDQPKDENATRRQEIMKEMREARKAGDEERIKELQEEMQKLRPQTNLEPLLTEVETILTDEQKEKLTEVRARMAERQGGRPRGPLAQIEQLREQLKLNEEQAKQYDELYNELKSKLMPSQGEGQNGELFQELMKASQEGDEERVKELRDQLEASRGDQEKLVTEFLEDVESFLEPSQKRALEEFRTQMNSRGGRNRLQLSDYFQYAARLDLDSQQKEALKDLQKESREAQRAVKRDSSATTELTEEYVKKIRDLLTDEQCAKFDQWVDEQKAGADRGRDRRERGMRGERGARRGPGAEGEGEDAPPPPDEPESEEP